MLTITDEHLLVLAVLEAVANDVLWCVRVVRCQNSRELLLQLLHVHRENELCNVMQCNSAESSGHVPCFESHTKMFSFDMSKAGRAGPEGTQKGSHLVSELQLIVGFDQSAALCRKIVRPDSVQREAHKA